MPRSARLIVGGNSLAVDDVLSGYATTSFDLGYPTVRDDINNRADADGSIDFTRYFGQRVITLNLMLIPGGTKTHDSIMRLFHPYLVLGQPVQLAYILDDPLTPQGNQERIITMRPEAVTWPRIQPVETLLQFGWIAADPFAYLPAQSSSLVAGGAVSGRPYPLTFNRIYPSLSAPGGLVLTVLGDVPTPPIFTVYGPATGNIVITTTAQTGPDTRPRVITLQPSFRVDAGNSLVIDCKQRTITLMTGGTVPSNVYGQALQSADWPRLAPGVPTEIDFATTGAGGTTQLRVTWQSAWLA